MIGEYREASIWFRNQAERDQAELAITLLFKEEEAEQGIVYSDIEFYEEIERLPAKPTPESKALVGTARILAVRDLNKIDLHFLTELQPSELKFLRGLTLKAYLKAFPGAPDLPTHNIDQIICGRGPDVARRLLRTH